MKSREALRRLADEVRAVRDREYALAARNRLNWLYATWHPTSRLAILKASSVGVCVVLAILLLCDGGGDTVTAGLVILVMTMLNLAVTGLDGFLREHEIYRRTDRLITELEEESGREWNSGNYPHLHTPMSASVVLQWAIRNGEMVNVPWALLVKDDIIYMKPGQISPARCRLLDENINLTLEQGETFHMDAFKRMEKSLLPEFKISMEPQRFILEETPYLAEMECILKNARHRPVSKLNKNRHFMFSMVELAVLPAFAILLVVWNLCRYNYNLNWYLHTSFDTLFLIEPAIVGIPLLSLSFPAWWIATNHAALASVLYTLRQCNQFLKTADPFDDTLENPEMEERSTEVSCSNIGRIMKSSLLGTGEYLCRTENLLHTLGSVTSFCCTDKKGLLSWQNPSAEKIFFFKPKSEDHLNLMPDELNESDITPEILTVTHDHDNPFGVDFDDPQWKNYLPNLKPLGLSILLNTCNLWTEEKYTYFFQHLLCESVREPLQGNVHDTNTLDLLPIPSRGCLCELSGRIGFPTGYENEFELKEQMQTFRPVIATAAGAGDSFTRNLTLAKLKFPFPHMVSLVMENQLDKSLQLVTQGTADIVLDSCVDAWVGTDLTGLNDDLKKKILEFYHRASLTSYCSAFAYRPLSYIPPWPSDSYYLELPHNSSPFLSQYNRPLSDHIDRVSTAMEISDNITESSAGSTDSKTDDVYSCIESQCNQTFLGMVQMQYQARVDIVQFIDLLEKACIRFVHFSKENELRSRVFSEKMGLESGWNCHISLRSDVDLRSKTRQMYSRKWVTKKYSSEKPSAKHFMSASMPENINDCPRHIDLPKFGDSCKPLLTSVAAEASTAAAAAAGDTSMSYMSTTGQCEAESTSSSSMLQYDMSNRAQLPCGIENIRPHLEEMDNVPLLVSLFTDCTPTSTREMVKILQENSEVVTTMGSAANFHNMRIFLAADASLAVEPLYPQVCQHVSVYSYPRTGLSPTDLASHLTSVASSALFKRDDQVTIYGSIIASRRHVIALRHILQFWTSVSVFLSLYALVCLLLALPSPLSVLQQLLVSLLYLPILSTALFFSTYDRNIRNISTGKNNELKISREILCYSIWCYSGRFVIPLLSALTAHMITVSNILPTCSSTAAASSHCSIAFSVLQDVNCTFITLLIILISLTFVSRTDQIWKLKPRKSWHILCAGLAITLAQFVYLMMKLAVYGAAHISVLTWILYPLALFFTILVNEAIKRQEIKINVRIQKRARLDFGTKLGINSPF
eukprot:TRINITY_DN3780_c0_g1_i10.p1 TRINITY_DN3780_c0_g1~~TRINITY_DN3780_c0_g1_i10.p1  ORF type:complete len:1258 (-),score=324.01 TRINITY_DN3780_c0_g1_i10:602-4375(-)